MKNIIFSLLICVLSIDTSCGSGQKGVTNDDDGGLVSIDISAEYPQEDIHLQEIADVEYIPLAMSDEVLLSYTDNIFYLSDRFIMIYSQKTGTISAFNRAGDILSHFNHRGFGPNEYTRISAVVFDEKAEEFFVVTPALDIIVYSFEGRHKRTLPIPDNWWITASYNFDDKSLLVYDEGGMSGGEFSTTPYRLISKTDGSVMETLAIEMPQRYSTTYIHVTEITNGTQSQEFILSVGANQRMGGNEFTIADISSDTLYRFSRDQALTRVLVRTPSVHASEPRMVWSANLVTDDFIVLTIVTMDFESALAGKRIHSRQLVYNFKTKQITSDPVFIDNNNPSGRWFNLSNTELPSNTATQMLNPLELKDAYDEGKLSGKLATITRAIKEGGNPVLMIVKFK